MALTILRQNTVLNRFHKEVDITNHGCSFRCLFTSVTITLQLLHGLADILISDGKPDPSAIPALTAIPERKRTEEPCMTGGASAEDEGD